MSMGDKMKKIVFLMIMVLFIAGCPFFFGDPEVNAAVASGNPEECRMLEASKVDNCLSRIYPKLEEPEKCSEIKDESYRNSCYGRAAISSGKHEYCEKAGGKFSIENCYADIGADTGNLELCDKAGSSRASCYGEVAVDEESLYVCEKLPKGYDKDHCLLKFAQGTDNKDVCARILDDTSSRDSCFSHFGMKGEDPAFCDNINDERMRDDCYLKVGTKINGNLVCKKIEDDRKEANCHYQIAQNLEDAQFCNDIWKSDENYYVLCVKQVAVKTKDKRVCSEYFGGKPKEKESCEMQVQNAIES